MKMYKRTEEVRGFKIGYTKGNTFADSEPNDNGKFKNDAVVVDLSPELVSRYTPRINQYLTFKLGSGKFHGVHAGPWFEDNYTEVKSKKKS